MYASPGKPGPETGKYLIARDCGDSTGLQFGFPPVRLALPCGFDFGVCIQACNEALEEMRTLLGGQFQDFSFQGFELGAHADLQDTCVQQTIACHNQRWPV